MEMQSQSLAGNKASGSTQAYLDIAEIKEGTIILKDGALRAVIAVSSTNFSLKSADEQNALIGTYQGFLNSLEFPIQILMQSRRLDIHSYLDKLRSIMGQQTNELLRMQTQEYIEYVNKLVEFASIMNKTFYVIIPFTTAPLKKGVFGKLGSMFNPVGKVSLKEKEFEQHREELYRRVNQVQGALSGMNLRAIPLTTEDLIELMYNSYNLDTATPLPIKSLDDLDIVKE